MLKQTYSNMMPYPHFFVIPLKTISLDVLSSVSATENVYYIPIKLVINDIYNVLHS